MAAPCTDDWMKFSPPFFPPLPFRAWNLFLKFFKPKETICSRMIDPLFSSHSPLAAHAHRHVFFHYHFFSFASVTDPPPPLTRPTMSPLSPPPSCAERAASFPFVVFSFRASSCCFFSKWVFFFFFPCRQISSFFYSARICRTMELIFFLFDAFDVFSFPYFHGSVFFPMFLPPAFWGKVTGMFADAQSFSFPSS